MSSGSSEPFWSFRVNAEVTRCVPAEGSAGRVAAMFGLQDGTCERLYEDFAVALSPGQIVAVVGPSGAGKSVLLRDIARQMARAIRLPGLVGTKSDRPAIDLLRGGSLKDRLAVLSRCGLAEVTALVAPARKLSGGQQYRLALARALHRAKRRGGPVLVLADEFCATLDESTAAVLCRQMRKIVSASQVGLLVATPRAELLEALAPEVVIVKPLGEAARRLRGDSPRRRGRGGVKLPDPRKWRIVRGRLADYKTLQPYHYLTGPPACNKRVYVIRTPKRLQRTGAPPLAAVLVVSPPVISVRGRNVATFGRYTGRDRRGALRRLNREVETISRVIVHPMYRGCGLGVRLVKHAIRTAPVPIVEALAAMGRIHPLFVRAGMRLTGLFHGPTHYYNYYLSVRKS